MNARKWDPFARKKRYLFEPRVLRRIAKEAAALSGSVKEKHAYIIQELAKTYPGHIRTQQSWVFNNAGGAMGQMTLLHGSLREYLILFGTSVGTEGHSGRYSAEVFDFVYDGEMWCCIEGQMDRMVFNNGKGAYLPASLTKQYRIPDHAWMLEYGRGGESIIDIIFGREPKDLGVRPDGTLKPLQNTPKGVHSQTKDPRHYIPPIHFSDPLEEIRQRLKEVLTSLPQYPRIKLVKEDSNYLRFIDISWFWRWKDDIEFYIDTNANLVHFRSSPRYGYTDGGFNRRRMEIIHQKFYQKNGAAN
jgi:C-8 sterol isomerase